MKSKFKAKHKIITPQLNKQKSQKNSPLCTVYSPLCTQCTPNKVKNISNNINIVIWNNIEGHQTQFRFFEQNFKKSVKSLHVISYFDSTNCLQATCCLLEWYVIYNEQTIPLTCDETDNKVMTPRVTLAGTQSTSIQKDTQEMATIRIEGK